MIHLQHRGGASHWGRQLCAENVSPRRNLKNILIWCLYIYVGYIQACCENHKQKRCSGRKTFDFCDIK